MKKSEKKMNFRTKRLLIISLACLAVGIIFMVIGFFKGPSIWAAWDGKQVITSNYAGTFKEKKELAPFSNVLIEVPSAVCTIQEGEAYSIEMASCLPGVKPVIQEADGLLAIKMENYESISASQIMPLEERFYKENYIIITVPAGTKLNEIRLTQHENWYGDILGISRDVRLNGISAAALNCDTGFYYSGLTIDNCNIDQVNLKDSRDIYINKLNSDTIQLNYSENVAWYANDTLQAKSVTANSFSTNFEDANKTRLIETGKIEEINEIGVLSSYSKKIKMEDCAIQNLDLIGTTITLTGVETQKASVLTQRSLTVKNCVMKGETVLRSAGVISMGLSQPISDFNGTAMVGAGYMNGPVTELVDFGTPEYNHGYLTDESKAFGTQTVEISVNEYGYLNSYRDEMMRSEKQGDYSMPYNDQMTTQAYYGHRVDEAYAKYYDYVELTRDYDQEMYEERCSVEVYNKKTVTYFVNEAGEKNYVEPYNNPSVLKINSDINTAQRCSFGAGPNKLDVYSVGSSELKFGN